MFGVAFDAGVEIIEIGGVDHAKFTIFRGATFSKLQKKGQNSYFLRLGHMTGRCKNLEKLAF